MRANPRPIPGILLAVSACLIALYALMHPSAARAQIETSTCLAIAQLPPAPRLWRAQAERGKIANDEVRITYVGHSAFRIESAQGISIITDFNGNIGSGGLPTVVTMNHAHSTHYTNFIDPGIEHVLRGWNPEGDGPARHELRLADVLIRNVATDLYSNGIMIERDGNSIFIFEIAGLCIGHLGHLHHKLTPEHIAQIGRLDVLFMPVDGTYTMSQEGMIELAKALRSSIVIPMHFFSSFSLQRFLAGMQGSFDVDAQMRDEMVISLRTLPSTPQVQVLLPY